MWKHPQDGTAPIITAKVHVASAHKKENVRPLPPRAVVFCIGCAMDFLMEHYPTEIVLNRLPRFLGSSQCLSVTGHSDVCFVHGGYGSPAAADTVETLVALGVKELTLVGMCGGFAEQVQVGDIILPTEVLSEEGTSLHYYEAVGFLPQSERLLQKQNHCFRDSFSVHSCRTVTTDAVYRQTFFKEAYWRGLGCAGIDMEASAFLSVSACCGAEAGVSLLVSDRHPLSEEEMGWEWGGQNFEQIKERFLETAIRCALEAE